MSRARWSYNEEYLLNKYHKIYDDKELSTLLFCQCAKYRSVASIKKKKWNMGLSTKRIINSRKYSNADYERNVIRGEGNSIVF